MALARSISFRKIRNAAKMVSRAATSPAASGAVGLPVAAVEKVVNHCAEWPRAVATSMPRSCSSRPLSQSATSTRYWMSSGAVPPTSPATGTSASRARPRPSGLPLAAASISASSRVAAATTAASASIRLYRCTHQPADRSGRSAAVRNSWSRSRNQVAPSVKKTVNTFMTPPPAVRAAPLSTSPGLGMQPISPPGPLAHGGTGPRGGSGGGAARAACGISTSHPARAAASLGLGGRRIVELLEALGGLEQLAGGAGGGLLLHRHRARYGGGLDQIPVSRPAQPQGRGRIQRLGGKAAVVAVQHQRPQGDLGVSWRVAVQPVAEQAGAQQRPRSEEHTSELQSRENL